MFLYNKTDKEIEVYTMQPNLEKLSEYRKKEMTPIIMSGEALLKAQGNEIYSHESLVRTDIKPVSLSKLNYNNSFNWHSLDKYKESDDITSREKEVLDNFYNGEYNNKTIVQVKDFNTQGGKDEIIRYLLLTEYYQQLNKKFLTMDNILVISKSLYLLQLLEKGEFSRVCDEDISPQLQVFDIPCNPVKKFSIHQIKEMYDAKLSIGDFEDVMHNIDVTQKILRKIK